MSFALSDDPARRDVARIHTWLASNDATPGLARTKGERQIAGAHCLDAHGVYASLGFETPQRPDRLMERLSPEFLPFLEGTT